MARSKYRPDFGASGMGGYLKTDAKLQAALLAIAEDGASHARAIAPVDTGAYAASFGVSTESGRSDSVGATLYNDSDHAAIVEYVLTHTLAQTADYLNGKS